MFYFSGGCCCDYRRAVVVLNILGIIFYTISVILNGLTTSGLGYALANDSCSDFYVTLSDGTTEDVDCETMVIIYSVLTGIAALGFIAAIIGLIGALKYNVCMIGFEVLSMVLILAFSIWLHVSGSRTAAGMAASIAFSVIIDFLLIYPSVMLIMEIKSGKMSAETYKREAHSCCCQPNV